MDNNNNSEYDFRKAEHEAEVKEYETKRSEIIQRHKERLTKLAKKKVIYVTFLIIAIIIYVLVHELVTGFLPIRNFGHLLLNYLVTFILALAVILVVDNHKKIKATRFHERYEIGRMVHVLEDKNIFVEREYMRDSKEEIEHNEFHAKSIRNTIITIAVVATMIVSFIAWLKRFDANQWRKMPWKRKYMVDSLLSQQLWEDGKTKVHKYNVKYWDTQEVIDLFSLPEEAREYGKEPYQIFEDEEGIHYVFFAWHDKKKDINYYIYYSKYPQNDDCSLGYGATEYRGLDNNIDADD